jgi:hypothetical protein
MWIFRVITRNNKWKLHFAYQVSRYLVGLGCQSGTVGKSERLSLLMSHVQFLVDACLM